MYAGQVNSPETTITNNIATIDTTIYVLDPARVPTPLPNIMTLGTGTNAETVKVLSIADNALTVERGFQGIAKDWLAGTIIARNFTAYDHDTFKDNIEDLETAKISKSLATAADQALVSTGAGAWAVKTLAQFKTWLGLKAAAFLDLDVEGGVASHNALATHEAENANKAHGGFQGAFLTTEIISQSIPDSTFTPLSWFLVEYDTKNFYNALTPTRLTVPLGVTKVRLSGNFNFIGNATGQRRGEIRINGNISKLPSVTKMAPGTEIANTNLSTGVFKVTAGDYFELVVWQNSGGALDVRATNATLRDSIWLCLEVVE